MPQIGNDTLREKDMWGISTFDQLNCRIQFKDSVYQGLYTPPSEKPYIEFTKFIRRNELGVFQLMNQQV